MVDCGGFEKLERFGRYVTVRPEPQAIWHKSLPEEEWERMASAVFRRDANSEERGRWLLGAGMPEQWRIDYRYRGMSLRMRLASLRSSMWAYSLNRVRIGISFMTALRS